MPTSRPVARVSLIAAFVATSAVAACASTRSASPELGPVELAGAPHPDVAARTFRFDNQGEEFVRVYLVVDQREFPLGRVERGSTATLRLPQEVLDGTQPWMRLTVRAGTATPNAPGVATMGVVPVSTLLSQRWTYAGSATREITGMPVAR